MVFDNKLRKLDSISSLQGTLKGKEFASKNKHFWSSFSFVFDPLGNTKVNFLRQEYLFYIFYSFFASYWYIVLCFFTILPGTPAGTKYPLHFEHEGGEIGNCSWFTPLCVSRWRRPKSKNGPSRNIKAYWIRKLALEG